MHPARFDRLIDRLIGGRRHTPVSDCDQLDRGRPSVLPRIAWFTRRRNHEWRRGISLPGPVTDLVYKHVIVRRVAPDALEGAAKAGSRISRNGHFLCHVRQRLPGVSTEMRGLQPCARGMYDPSRWRRDCFWVLCSVLCWANIFGCIDGSVVLVLGQGRIVTCYMA